MALYGYLGEFKYTCHPLISIKIISDTLLHTLYISFTCFSEVFFLSFLSIVLVCHIKAAFDVYLARYQKTTKQSIYTSFPSF